MWKLVTRGVQRLTLLLPIKEKLEDQVSVIDGQVVAVYEDTDEVEA